MIFPLAHIDAKFILDERIYSVETFKIVFNQSKDFKGQPQHEVKGGQFMISLSQAVSNDLLLWAKQSTQLKSGEILFQTDLGITVYRIKFTNAYCITLTREISSKKGTRTLLMIAPEQLSLNGFEHNNFWK